ncbi:tape measure protein [Phenylobacterium sp.]|uniref:tape measure protein n=1 Tax=Phenylobacterium sp. TaxID=1871053 RepID=UPI000C979102|nr:tape measure protein [Phenylobacterium sp.]MAK80254.1 hypothetical protein [Phenylobacterium sp.]
MADQNFKLRFDFIANNKNFNNSIGVSQAKIKSFGNQMSRTGRMLSTRLTAPLVLAGGLALRQAANFERLQTTLNTLTGSADAGAAAFERLVEFSAKTPFQLDELVKVNNTLMGFGLNAEEAFGSLSMLGDIAGIVGGDLQSIGIAFGQAAAEGRVMTRDLRQFINNGVPILDILAESMGVARGEIMDMASEGKITFDILNTAFRDATSEGGKFAGGMNTLSQTLNGLFSTLKDNVNIALAELGQEIAEALNLKEGIPALSNQIRSLVDNFKRLDPETREAIIKFGLVAAALPPLLILIGTLVTALSTTAAGYIALGAAIIAANEAIKGFIEQLTGIKDFNIIAFIVGPLGQLAEIMLRIAKIKNPFKELFKLNDPTNLPDDFIGPRTQEQTFNQDPLLASILQGTSVASDPVKQLENTTSEVRKVAKAVNLIQPRGIVELNNALIQTGTLLTEIPEKTKPLMTSFKLFGEQIIPAIGQALMDSFANLSEGESVIERLTKTIKALVGRLLAAAAAAAVLAFFLSGGKGVQFFLSKASDIFKGLSGGIDLGLAKGGIVSGPTTALIGEYPGARSNPEVVAPLNKLKSMIGGGSMQGEFVLRGQDLVIALQRAEKSRNRII